MDAKKKFLINFLLGFALSSLVAALSLGGYTKRLEFAGSDLLFRLRGFLCRNPAIAIIEINDDDLRSIGRWPWERTWHAAMTKALKQFGAEKIYFDMIFPEPSEDPEADMVFAESMRYAENVYLPFVYQGRDIRRETALYPVEGLYDAAEGKGSINVYPDIDGTIREMPVFFAENGKFRPHIALKLAMEYGGYEITEIARNHLTLSDNVSGKLIRVPLSKNNKLVINWMGKWGETFTHYSYIDVLANYNRHINGKPLDIDVEPLEGSLALVAVTAIGLYDIRPTPLEAEYPGIGAIATVIDNFLNNNFMREAKPGVNLFIIYLLGILPFCFVSGERSLREILSVGFAATVFFFITVKLFERNYLINYVPGLISLFASYTSAASYHFIRVSVERQKFFHMAVTDGLTGLANIRYFMMILNTEYLLAKREPERGFCVVMMDIDFFKKFNDTYGHAVGDLVLKKVAETFKASVRTSDIVARYGGEEMVALLRVTKLKNAIAVAEKIRKNIETGDYKDERNSYNVTVSLGVAQFDPENDDMETLMKRADAGLYKAKENGRNRVETIENI